MKFYKIPSQHVPPASFQLKFIKQLLCTEPCAKQALCMSDLTSQDNLRKSALLETLLYKEQQGPESLNNVFEIADLFSGKARHQTQVFPSLEHQPLIPEVIVRAVSDAPCPLHSLADCPKGAGATT